MAAFVAEQAQRGGLLFLGRARLATWRCREEQGGGGDSLAAGMRGQAMSAARWLSSSQLPFFSCCLPWLPPAALFFPPCSPSSPLGAAGREAAKCLSKRRQEPRCSRQGKEEKKKKKHLCTNQCPCLGIFLFSESSASSRCCSPRAQRRAHRLSSASGPGHSVGVSVLCCLSVPSSSSNKHCLKPRASCWKDISRGWCRGARGSALPPLPIGTGAAAGWSGAALGLDVPG